MNKRINACFKKPKNGKCAGLITFTMACDPDFDTSLDILNGLPDAGADIIEIGMPFSDPMADGSIIQEAGQRGLAKGGSVKNTLRLTREFRKTHPTTPVILMGYYNPVYHYGLNAFCKDAIAAGVDGLIIVDVPPEEEAEIRAFTSDTDIAIIRLVTPTSHAGRLPVLMKEADGFIYYVAVAGVTGTKSATIEDLKERVKLLRQHTKLPVAVGFGIKTPAQVKDIAQIADAVVVGSALVKVIADTPKETAALVAHNFVSTLAKALEN